MRENKINRSNFLWIDFSGFFQGLFCFSQLNSTISWTHTSSYPLPDSSREFSSSDSTGESTGMSSIGESTAKLYKNNVIHVIKNEMSQDHNNLFNNYHYTLQLNTVTANFLIQTNKFNIT